MKHKLVGTHSTRLIELFLLSTSLICLGLRTQPPSPTTNRLQRKGDTERGGFLWFQPCVLLFDVAFVRGHLALVVELPPAGCVPSTDSPRGLDMGSSEKLLLRRADCVPVTRVTHQSISGSYSKLCQCPTSALLRDQHPDNHHRQ